MITVHSSQLSVQFHSIFFEVVLNRAFRWQKYQSIADHNRIASLSFSISIASNGLCPQILQLMVDSPKISRSINM